MAPEVRNPLSLWIAALPILDFFVLVAHVCKPEGQELCM